ncbi:MAG TPA: hypothetical protein DD990_25770, partial [Cyanobacteria bacterium UBA11368]|nr:hypothetical protein [Cyanobacteria bacterium UBA11368]
HKSINQTGRAGCPPHKKNNTADCKQVTYIALWLRLCSGTLKGAATQTFGVTSKAANRYIIVG